jgi:tetratricopeptide (TPR) repeat protein
MYTIKHFGIKTKEMELKDKNRLEEIVSESKFFKLLFKVSLHKNNRITNILFMFLFNFSMPVIGYIFSLWITWYLNNVSYDRKVSNTNILNLDEFRTSFLKIERIFGEGSMSELMTNEDAPKSKKLKALSILVKNLSPNNLKIIRQALSSKDDEIRMYGYAIINKAEKSLNIKINHYLELFNQYSQSKEKKYQTIVAEASKELAPLYWEMVYTELSHDALKDDFLQEVKKYIKIAKEFYIPELDSLKKTIQKYEKKIKEVDEERKASFVKKLEDDKEKIQKYSEICAKLYILMGRVYMNKKDYENAQLEFTLAQQLHPDQLVFIAPYLAEIHFIMGNYRVVSSIMNQAKDLELNSTLYPIVEQWKVS